MVQRLRWLEAISGTVPIVLTYAYFPALIAEPVATIAKLTPFVLLSTVIPLFASGAPPANILYSVAVSSTLGTALLYTVAVLFGAPVTVLFSETAGLSLHCALTSLLPALTYTRPPTLDRLQRPHALTEWADGSYGYIIGTLAGAYAGCIPIPLDWDRPWQRWPVTVYTGACIGLALGTISEALYDLYTIRSKPKTAKPSSKAKTN
ncbi:hypothetical protein PYCC9005_002672 [Savitreella phatthalungensis]